MSFTELATVVDGTLHNPSMADNMFQGVSIDSRSVKTNELFIAINGEVHDGHDYVEQAVKSGASVIISEKRQSVIERFSNLTPVISVDDSHQAMLKLAAYYRNQLNAKFIAITGSNGKTTTKELTYRLIKAVEEKIFCSPGNFNNLFGVPLALFQIEFDTKVVVMELGISTKNEMPKLAEIVKPDLVLFTNVGPSHLEFMNSVEGVARAKLELLMKADSNVPAIVNIDDQILYNEALKIRKNLISFGIERKADFVVDNIAKDENNNSLITIEGHTFVLPLIGRHQVYNLLAAYASFKTLVYNFENVDTKKIGLNTAPMRGQIIRKADICFVVDCYNANPESVKAGLESFFEFETSQRRIIILGDMLELGKEAEFYHKQIGDELSIKEYDLLITVGPLSKHINETAKSGNSYHYKDASQAAKEIKNLIQKDDFVFLKGSRGIGLELILNEFNYEESD